MGIFGAAVIPVVASLMAMPPDGAPGVETRPQPLSIKDALGQKVFPIRVPFGISPDGRRLAYALQDRSRRIAPKLRGPLCSTPIWCAHPVDRLRLRVLEVGSGAARNLTEGRGTSWGPAWSPDGCRLAFYSDRAGVARVWIWEAATGELRELVGAAARPVYGFDLPARTTDGRKILVKSLPEGVSPGDADAWADRATPRGGEPAAGVGGDRLGASLACRGGPDDLRRRDQGDGPGVGRPGTDRRRWRRGGCLVRRVVLCGLVALARRHAVLLSVAKGFEGLDSGQILYDILVVARQCPPGRRGGAAPWTTGSPLPSRSPDGRRLAWLTSGATAKGDCLVVPADGGVAESLTPGEHPDFGHPYLAPLWSDDGRSIYLLGGQLWRVRVAENKAREPVSSPGGPTIVEGAGPAREGLVARRRAVDDPAEPRRADQSGRISAARPGHGRAGPAPGGGPEPRRLPDLRDGDLAGRFVRRLCQGGRPAPAGPVECRGRLPLRTPTTRINPGLDGYAFGAGRVIRWRASNGDELRGAVILPAGHRECLRYPLVVDVYAGGRRSGQAQQLAVARETGWKTSNCWRRGATLCCCPTCRFARVNWLPTCTTRSCPGWNGSSRWGSPTRTASG